MFSFDFWPIVLLVLSLGGHTDTYRSGCYGHGAFELCLPSSGILYQNCLLRTQYLGNGRRLTWSWGEDRRPRDRVTLPIVCVGLWIGAGHLRPLLLLLLELMLQVRGVCE